MRRHVVALGGGAMKQHQPWQWIARVASGDTAGHRTESKEVWLDYVRRHIREHMFYQ